MITNFSAFEYDTQNKFNTFEFNNYKLQKNKSLIEMCSVVVELNSNEQFQVECINIMSNIMYRYTRVVNVQFKLYYKRVYYVFREITHKVFTSS